MPGPGQGIKPDKAAGPDSLPATVLEELSHEIAPILELIYIYINPHCRFQLIRNTGILSLYLA